MKIRTFQYNPELEISSASTIGVVCYKTVQGISISIVQCSDLGHNYLNWRFQNVERPN